MFYFLLKSTKIFHSEKLNAPWGFPRISFKNKRKYKLYKYNVNNIRMKETMIGGKDIVSGIHVIKHNFLFMILFMMSQDSLIWAFSIDKIRNIEPGGRVTWICQYWPAVQVERTSGPNRNLNNGTIISEGDLKGHTYLLLLQNNLIMQHFSRYCPRTKNLGIGNFSNVCLI